MTKRRRRDIVDAERHRQKQVDHIEKSRLSESRNDKRLLILALNNHGYLSRSDRTSSILLFVVVLQPIEKSIDNQTGSDIYHERQKQVFHIDHLRSSRSRKATINYNIFSRIIKGLTIRRRRDIVDAEIKRNQNVDHIETKMPPIGVGTDKRLFVCSGLWVKPFKERSN